MSKNEFTASEIEKIVDEVKSEKVTGADIEVLISSENKRRDIIKSGIRQIPKDLSIAWQNLYYDDTGIDEKQMSKVENEIEKYCQEHFPDNDLLHWYTVDFTQERILTWIYDRRYSFIDQLTYPPEILYELRVNGRGYRFRGGEFLRNFRRSSRSTIFDFGTKYKLEPLEFLNFVVRLKQYENQDVTQRVHTKVSKRILKDFTTKNIFEKEVLDTLKNRYATGKVLTTIQYDGEKVESEFTDFQAFHICKGLKDQLPLYNKYIEGNAGDYDRAQAHILAMDLLKEQGRTMVNLVLSLPALPFRCPSFNVLFPSLDKARADGNVHPKIRLHLKISDNDSEEIEYEFYSQSGIDYINQICVRSKTRKTTLFHVSRAGGVLPVDNQKTKKLKRNITPVLELFYQITKSEEGIKQAALSYGLETGHCSVCGRELTNQQSILRGIGPICETYL